MAVRATLRDLYSSLVVHLDATSAPSSNRREEDLRLANAATPRIGTNSRSNDERQLCITALKDGAEPKALDKQATNNQIEDREQEDQAADKCLSLLFRV